MARLLRRVSVLALGIPLGVVAPGSSDRLKPPEPKPETPKTEQTLFVGHAPSDITRIGVTPEPTRKEALRSGFFDLGAALKALIALPVLLLGRLVLALLRRLMGAVAGPFAGFLAEVLFWAVLLFGLFILLWRLLFPGRSLAELFRNRRFLWILAAALALTLLRRVVLLWKSRRLIGWLLFAAACWGILFLLFRRVFRGIRPPEQTVKWIELPRF